LQPYGRKLSVNLSDLKHVDYGYCSTSHAAQGATVDRVIVNANSKAGEALVNAAQFYVSTSRARDDVLVLTDSIKGLQRAVSRNPQKETALEAFEATRLVLNNAKQTPSPPLSSGTQPTAQQQQSRWRGFSLAWRLSPKPST